MASIFSHFNQNLKVFRLNSIGQGSIHGSVKFFVAFLYGEHLKIEVSFEWNRRIGAFRKSNVANF
jgi:hypothetical protein